MVVNLHTHKANSGKLDNGFVTPCLDIIILFVKYPTNHIFFVMGNTQPQNGRYSGYTHADTSGDEQSDVMGFETAPHKGGSGQKKSTKKGATKNTQRVSLIGMEHSRCTNQER